MRTATPSTRKVDDDERLAPRSVWVRQGQTSPHEVDAAVRWCKEFVDVFRPTAG